MTETEYTKRTLSTRIPRGKPLSKADRDSLKSWIYRENKTIEEVANLIGGLSVTTLSIALNGKRISKENFARVTRFMEGIRRAA